MHASASLCDGNKHGDVICWKFEAETLVTSSYNLHFFFFQRKKLSCTGLRLTEERASPSELEVSFRIRFFFSYI